MGNKAQKQNTTLNGLDRVTKAQKGLKGPVRRTLEGLAVAGTITAAGLGLAKNAHADAARRARVEVMTKQHESKPIVKAAFRYDTQPGLQSATEKARLSTIDALLPSFVPDAFVMYCARDNKPGVAPRKLNTTTINLTCGGRNSLLQIPYGNGALQWKKVVFGKNPQDLIHTYAQTNFTTPNQKDFAYRFTLAIAKKEGVDLQNYKPLPSNITTGVQVPLEADWGLIWLGQNLMRYMAIKNPQKRMKKALADFYGAKPAPKPVPRVRPAPVDTTQPKPAPRPGPRVTPRPAPRPVPLAADCSFDTLKSRYELVELYVKHNAKRPDVRKHAVAMYKTIAKDCPAENAGIERKISGLDALVAAAAKATPKPAPRVTPRPTPRPAPRVVTPRPNPADCSFDTLAARYKAVNTYVRINIKPDADKTAIKAKAILRYQEIKRDCPAEDVKSRIAGIDRLMTAELKKQSAADAAAKLRAEAARKKAAELAAKKAYELKCSDKAIDGKVDGFKAEAHAKFHDGRTVAGIQAKYSVMAKECARSEYAQKKAAEAPATLARIVKEEREKTRILQGGVGLEGFSAKRIWGVRGLGRLRVGNLSTNPWNLEVFAYAEGGSNNPAGFDHAMGGVLAQYSKLRLGALRNFVLRVGYNGTAISLDNATWTESSGTAADPVVTTTGTRTDRDYESQTHSNGGNNGAHAVGIEAAGRVPLKGKRVKGVKVQAGVGVTAYKATDSDAVDTDHTNTWTDDKSDSNADPAIVDVTTGGSHINHRYTSNSTTRNLEFRTNLGFMLEFQRNVDFGLQLWAAYASELHRLTQGESGTQTFDPTVYNQSVGGFDISSAPVQRDPLNLSRTYNPSERDGHHWNLVPMLKLSWNSDNGVVDLGFGADLGAADKNNGLSAASMLHGYMLAMGAANVGGTNQLLYGINSVVAGPQLSAEAIFGYANFAKMRDQLRLEDNVLSSTTLPMELMKLYLQNAGDNMAESMPGFSIWVRGGAGVNLEDVSAYPIVSGAIMDHIRAGPIGVTLQYDGADQGARVTGVVPLTHGFNLRAIYQTRNVPAGMNAAGNATTSRTHGGGAMLVYRNFLENLFPGPKSE